MTLSGDKAVNEFNIDKHYLSISNRLPLDKFVIMDYDNDVLVRIHIKKDRTQAAYQSFRNAKTDFPVIAVAVAGKENQLFVSVGARPMKAGVIEKSGWLPASSSSDREIEALADWAKDQFIYGSNMRGSSEYREHLAYVYIKRGVKEVLENDH